MARIASPGGWKYRVRTVNDDVSVLAHVMWNPYRLNDIAGTTQVTAARMQVQANLINFDINGVAETVIGTYAGNSGGDDQIVFGDSPATVRALIERINGLELGFDRYRAGLGDFRPGFTIGTGDGIAVGLTNIMLGRHHQSASCPWRSGLEVFADSSGLATANIMSVGCGTYGAREGRGQEFPDNFQSEYTSTTAGVETRVRAQALSREKSPTSALEVRVTFVHFGAAYATNAKVITVFDQNDNTLFQETLGSGSALGSADKYNFDNPIASSTGPIFVQGVGTGALTDGPLTVGWYERVA